MDTNKGLDSAVMLTFQTFFLSIANEQLSKPASLLTLSICYSFKILKAHSVALRVDIRTLSSNIFLFSSTVLKSRKRLLTGGILEYNLPNSLNASNDLFYCYFSYLFIYLFIIFFRVV